MEKETSRQGDVCPAGADMSCTFMHGLLMSRGPRTIVVFGHVREPASFALRFPQVLSNEYACISAQTISEHHHSSKPSSVRLQSSIRHVLRCLIMVCRPNDAMFDLAFQCHSRHVVRLPQPSNIHLTKCFLPSVIPLSAPNTQGTRASTAGQRSATRINAHLRTCLFVNPRWWRSHVWVRRYLWWREC